MLPQPAFQPALRWGGFSLLILKPITGGRLTSEGPADAAGYLVNY